MTKRPRSLQGRLLVLVLGVVMLVWATTAVTWFDALNLHDAPSETSPMIDALNGLFVRIGTLMESERRFTADAAHELRTPIAAIRAQAQVALGESDDARRRHALQGTLEGCDRAARLVAQLLTLSRLETDAVPLLHTVDLAAIARQVVADIAPSAIGKRQALELEAAPEAPSRATRRCWPCSFATWWTTRCATALLRPGWKSRCATRRAASC